jgi:hypothetical protein
MPITTTLTANPTAVTTLVSKVYLTHNLDESLIEVSSLSATMKFSKYLFANPTEISTLSAVTSITRNMIIAPTTSTKLVFNLSQFPYFFAANMPMVSKNNTLPKYNIICNSPTRGKPSCAVLPSVTKN